MNSQHLLRQRNVHDRLSVKRLTNNSRAVALSILLFPTVQAQESVITTKSTPVAAPTNLTVQGNISPVIDPRATYGSRRQLTPAEIIKDEPLEAEQKAPATHSFLGTLIVLGAALVIWGGALAWRTWITPAIQANRRDEI